LDSHKGNLLYDMSVRRSFERYACVNILPALRLIHGSIAGLHGVLIKTLLK